MKTLSLTLRVLAVATLAVAATACGQRGPLYMPGDKPAKKSAPSPVQNAPVILKAPDDTKRVEAEKPKAN